MLLLKRLEIITFNINVDLIQVEFPLEHRSIANSNHQIKIIIFVLEIE